MYFTQIHEQKLTYVCRLCSGRLGFHEAKISNNYAKSLFALLALA